jgi:pimeloyl-ACP methyl ester carboxylesterase
MRERAVCFGPAHGLIGIVSEPALPRAGPRRAVLMSNIGMHHRIGPFRLYTEMARALASDGVFVLRFDLSGMGDSAMRPDGDTAAVRAKRDVRAAMDWLQRAYGIDDFVLLGLCSGVDSTHVVATGDQRVKGAIFIDGYAYPTPGFYVRHFLVRPLQPGRWVRFGRRLLRGERRGIQGSDGATVFEREQPTQPDFARDIGAMTLRGTRLLFIYTGGAYNRINSGRQVFEMLGAGVCSDNIQSELLLSADHVFSSTAQRALLFDRIRAWVKALPG